MGGEAFCPASQKNPGKGGSKPSWTSHPSHEPAFETISWHGDGKELGAYVSCQAGRWASGFSWVVTAANCPGTVSNEMLREGFIGERCHRDEREKKENKPGEIAARFCIYLCRRNCFKMSFGVLEEANSL